MTDCAAGPWWPAPAKLNLMLRVLGRRPDGYHRLQTVFQFIDRCDRLWFEVREDGRIRRTGEIAGVPEPDDLTIRAALALKAASGCRLGADIRVEKRLPMGGGLGGGSSDAATTLVALDRLWGTGLGTEALAAIGLTLGADVPVFVRGRAAWGEGVGDRLSPVDLVEPLYLVLVPACQVPTAAVFAHPELTRNSDPTTLADFVRGDARNDCMAVVRREYPPVADALDWLDAHGGGRLTGTGACVFTAYDRQDQATSAWRQAPRSTTAFVARGLNRSPLLDRLARADD